MSAYSVPDNQLHVMLSFMMKSREHNSDYFYLPPFDSEKVGTIYDPQMDTIQQLWNTLRQANDASLYARYGDDEPSELVPFVCVKDLPEPLAMIRIVQNFEYQACEYKGWYESKAKAICSGIIDLAIDKLMKATEDETGHSPLPWGFDGDIEPDPYFNAPKLSDVDKPEPGKVYRLF